MAILDHLFTASKYLAIITTTGIIGLLGILYFNQNLLIYPSSFPEGSRTSIPKPSDFEIENWQEITIESEDKIKLHCYLLKSTGARHTIIYYHANAGNMGHRLPISRELMNRLGCNVFMLSYRGYGKSEGVANEIGLKMDAQAALNYVLAHPELSKTKLIIFGQSIGGAVSVYIASKNQGKLQGLILENTFLSIPKLIPSIFPKIGFIAYFCHQKWNSESLIDKIDMPVLFLSGGKDEVVPPFHMRKLYEKYSEKQDKQFKSFVNGTHNDTILQDGYFDVITNFIKTLKGAGRTLSD